MGLQAYNAILNGTWAIQRESLETMLSIAMREHEYSDGNLEALEKAYGRPMENTERSYIRNGVAIVPVTGPMFRGASLFTRVSGATSYEMLALDIQAAVDDPNVKSILLKINSPGGEVNGTSQLAQYIKDARATKPVYAFIDGTGASAAYWLASAAERIVATDTAIVGSIGCQMGLRVGDESQGKTLRFVSSQSPMKNADPQTEAGAKAVQKTVDDLAAVFIQTVASNRGISVEKVLESYGQGDSYVASEALSRGMIDAVDTFEGLLASLQTEVNSMDYTKLTLASLTENRADLVAEIKASVPAVDVAAVSAQAAADERKRITDIEALSMPGAESVIAACKSDGTSVAEAAMKIIAAAKAAPATAAVATPAPAAGSDAIKVLVATETNNTMPVAGRTDDESKDELAEMAALHRKNGVIR